ncbi:MAG: metallophosphoesterase [Ruminococcus sp.]
MKKKICIREYHLQCSRTLGKPGKLRLAFLTDLHNRTEGEEGERIWELLDSAAPDLVLVGGDVLVGKPGKDIRAAVDFIKALAARYPVWYANGNHEQRITKHPEEYGVMGEIYDQEMKKTSAVRLINERAKVEIRGIPVTIYGFEPEERYYEKGMRKKGIRKDLEKQFGAPEKDCYTILLSHHPRYGKEYLDWGADLTLSGHYHGGVWLLGKQRGLITPDYRPLAGFCCGMRSREDSHMIVSAGVGEHTIPIRLHNPREVTVIQIDFS